MTHHVFHGTEVIQHVGLVDDHIQAVGADGGHHVLLNGVQKACIGIAVAAGGQLVVHGILDGHDALAVALHPAPHGTHGHGVAQVQGGKAAVACQVFVFIIIGGQHVAGEHIHLGAPGGFLLGTDDHQVLQHAVLGHLGTVHVQRGKFINEGIAVLGIGFGGGGIVQGLLLQGAGLIAVGPGEQFLPLQGTGSIVLGQGRNDGQKHQGHDQAKQAFHRHKTPFGISIVFSSFYFNLKIMTCTDIFVKFLP